MGQRENKVEKYLDSEFKALGGLTRKWTSPGQDGVPDRICIVNGDVYLVEVKTVDGKIAPVQMREQLRLSLAGATVRTVYGNEGVDELIEEVKGLEFMKGEGLQPEELRGKYRPTAKEVKHLRDITGNCLHACKSVLIRTNGNVGDSVNILRKEFSL